MKKTWKIHRVTGIIIFCILAMAAIFVSAADGNAESPKQVGPGVYSVLYHDISEYRTKAAESDYFTKYPTLDGCVFAGWYTSDSFTMDNKLNPEITSENEEGCKEIYAKFVAEKVLSVKGQLPDGTDSLSENTTMRVVTTVDSLCYQKVGFEAVFKETTYTGETNEVSKKLIALSGGKEMDLVPSKEFHEASVYFMACNLRGILPEDFDERIEASPYWITLDGTKVYGVSAAKSVKWDGLPTVCEAKVTHEGGNVDFYSTLETCFLAENSDNTYLADNDTVIVIQENIELEETLAVYDKVTLTNEPGKNVVIARNDNATKDKLKVMIDNYATGTGLVVQGNTSGTLSFDGKGTEYDFGCIDSDADSKDGVLTLKNISIHDFTTTGRSGGAIRTNGTVSMEGCKFDNIKLTGENNRGGVVYHDDNALNVINCEFTNNSTEASGGVIYTRTGQLTVDGGIFSANSATSNGGTIYINNGTINIKNSCDFNNNKANQGGAVYALKGTTTIDDCDFEANIVSGLGGAIYVGTGDTKKVVLQNGCTFINNRSEAAENGHGGAIYVEDRTLESSDSIFTGNEATTGNGGAICVAGGTLVENNSTFTNSKANHGGAIRLDNNISGATITGSKFYSNATYDTKPYNGGAISSFAKGNVDITKAHFEGNSSNSNGGAIYLSSGTMNLSGCTFDENTAVANGGAVCVTSGTLNEEKSVFTDNTGNHGGAIRVDKDATITITGSTFNGNKTRTTAKYNGGAISCFSESEKVTVIGAHFESNSSNNNGGAIYLANGTLDTDSCTFVANQSVANGGAIYLDAAVLLDEDESVFTGNTAVNGGAIYVTDTTTSATITGSEFSDNQALNGTASSENYGGAVYIGGATEQVEIEGATFEANIADNCGGAVYVNQGTVKIAEQSSFAGNIANGTNGGGAIYVRLGEVTIEESTFSNNGTATTNKGGAIYINNGTEIIIQNGCTFTGNQAVTGGAIYFVKGKIGINGCNFDGNIATGNAGAICVAGGTLNEEGSIFTNNEGNNGGAMRVDGGTVTITGSTFEGNKTRTTTAYNGGAINNNVEGTKVINATFLNNTAQGAGGAIRTTKSMTANGCIFDGNRANGKGNAVEHNGGTSTFVNTTLINQTADDFVNIDLVDESSAIQNTSDCDDGYQLSLLTNMKEEDFEAYCRRLVSSGYELYAENDMNGNLFRTYSTDAGSMVHTYWVKYSEEVRTIAANTTLIPAISPAISETKVTPMLHQLEALNSDETDGGMGYIIRLSDGRFIIIDGGRYLKTNAKAIYDFLVENASGSNPKNITIAAWFFTHAHDDHTGAFRYFAEHVSDFPSTMDKLLKNVPTITIESVMLNACNTKEQLANCKAGTGDEKTAVETALKTYYPNAKVYKPLTGQVYTFADTSIEILYTMPDFLPNVIAQEADNNGGDYNIESVVSMIDIDNTTDKNDKFFVMADTNRTACEEMSKRYGTYMESDYVQVAHHGLNEISDGTSHNSRRHGPDKITYDYIVKDDKSTIILWPTSREKYEERSGEAGLVEVNIYLRKLVREENNVVAGDGGKTFTF